MAARKKANGNGAGADRGAPATTAQRLGAILKSSRDLMRKDKGLSGEIDRIPVLTWIMFLKFLDDMESMREQEATLSGKKFKPAIEPPYRWRDWAAKEDGITGDELIAFINQEECRRPDGSRGAGLFAYLRALRGAEGGDRRDVIATVFKGTVNRMINGYLLRDVINKVNGIHFTSSDEIHTLGNFYESMLKEMRDAAGDSGEFYTPRAVVRFMVEVIDPKIGETVLDPACGTGGFLVEAYTHIEKQCKTVQQRRQLQQETILGNEAKPLPYLLAQMNLLLHGLETPRIDPGNSLAVPLREIGDKERVDVILTNPPFGGEEERGILSNFPEDKQTAETALLFLQLIMRKLKRAPKPGRAAVVVPNGVLFGDGIAARIKEELLREFNLHTIVRLPNGVFEPYTPIPTNILFFDRSRTTSDVWFYEQPLGEGRKKYSKTNPLLFEEFGAALSWWRDRTETEFAWKVGASVLLERGCNLDLKNPRAPADLAQRTSRDVLNAISVRKEAFDRALTALRTAATGSAR
jgi:type I restriction enzyme M protein